MLDPDVLYEVADPAPPSLPPGQRPVMVQALDGFLDVAGVVRTAREHLLDTLEHRVAVRFDVDQLLDYRSRRPVLTFERDHWAGYDEPELALHVLRDAAGTEFLLLAGPEPDVQWERFIAALLRLVERFSVRLSVGFNTIPMAVPHTRPTGVTAHGTRQELLVGYEPWLNTVQVPGSAGHLLEYRLGQAGHDAMGFAAHVPQYLAQAEFPSAAAVLLDAVSGASGLSLPTDALRGAGERARKDIDAQVAQSEELRALVGAMEQQYDAFVASRGRSLLAEDGGRLPTGDELGAQLEQFLASQIRPDEGRDA